MGGVINMLGQRFGRLLVIERLENNARGQARWRCVCDCGEYVDTLGSYLRNGDTKSCGCLSKDLTIERNKTIHKKFNRMEDCGDYVTMYTSKDEPFLVDKADYNKVKDICWCKNGAGYLTGNVGDGEVVLLHRYLMDCPPDMDVDHKHGKNTKYDNRRSNLRLATKSENMQNKGLQTNNVSGTTGVYWSKPMGRWVAQITYGINPKTGKQKCHYLGSYENYDVAVRVRKEAEEKYFGEFSYDNSQNS